MLNNDTYCETLYDGYGQSFSVDKLLFEHQTEHQHLVIFENPFFGRTMALDGAIQTTERDEFIYHEMMTHVPVLAHGQVKRVLIIGGGDGAMLRELFKHKSIEQVTMVEIDKAVIDMCKQWLPHHSAGAFDDPRVNIVIADGIDFVSDATKNTDGSFDVIISDCTDPIGPGEVLFTSTFYAGCQRLLTKDGIFVAQNGVSFMQIDEVKTTHQRLGAYMKDCSFYSAAVPTYVGGIMTFAWGADSAEARSISLDEITERFNASNITTRYYTPAIHKACFALPAYVEQVMQEHDD